MAKKMRRKFYYVTVFASGLLLYMMTGVMSSTEADEYGVYYPTECEVCKYLAHELQERLVETGKTHDVVQTGYNSMNDGATRKTKYVQSELRLIESMDGICDNILEYNIHKERKDSTRFAKGMSETFRTLHGLVDKGVKVDLGIPYDLWDKPSAEVVALKSKCEFLLEKHEEDIEDWFFHHQDVALTTFLCSHRALKKGDDGCLLEQLIPNASKKRLSDERSQESKDEQAKRKKSKEKATDEL